MTMSEEPREGEQSPLRRVAAIVRSWDGPNSRVGLEVDLAQMPWGPFDALGKRLSILLPVEPGSAASSIPSESPLERALRHVEHAADRSGEFARLQSGNEELWLRSQETWEWLRRHLTTQWLQKEVDGQPPVQTGESSIALDQERTPLPSLPGAASTLLAVAKALRALPLAGWEEAASPSEGGAPTREEAIRTLQGVARVLGSGGAGDGIDPPVPEPPHQTVEEPKEEPDTDPDQVSFDFAKGYDEGYHMGRRVGLALGRKKGARPAQP
jgi:hypothetical protein